MYNDQKNATDRVGKKLAVSCKCDECSKYRNIIKQAVENTFKTEMWDEAQKEVDRENMRGINFGK